MAQRAIGVDLGGSHVLAAVVDENGTITSRHEAEVTDRSFEIVLKQLEATIAGALAKAGSVVGIGVGSPGNIDAKTGAVRYSPNFGSTWENAPLGERLRARFSVPVFVGNDARCATLGEFTYGVGRGTKDFVLLTIGTGIGGGIVADGSLILGAAMGAGEIGHHQIRPTDGFLCSCGKVGCFEVQASGTGLLRHAMALAPSFPRSALLDVPRENLGSKKIRRAAQAGDLHALAAWRNFTSDLALGLANIVAFLNPDVIALGGGVSSAEDFLLDAVRPRVDALTTMAPRGSTRISIAQFENDAGALGAATMAARGGLTVRKVA
ncbi:MAG: ROK family protein [Candidatus Eremiobacteraeota bacterium]|nr:ROK family protein [Candidatus Eremiobacteraeota bacterium]MBV8355719.1 ROK family protein [Candidatus Eremiobacteraeota bacterium]